MSKFILDLNSEDQKKFEEICDLIPEKNIPRQERIEPNKIIREELSNASNKVICCLAFNMKHQLSLKELRRRFREEKFSDLEELFWLVELVYEEHNTTENEYYKMIRKEIERIAPLYNSEEIAKIAKRHIDYNGFTNRMLFLEFMIVCSSHKEKIIQEIKGMQSFDEMINRIKYLENLKVNSASS